MSYINIGSQSKLVAQKNRRFGEGRRKTIFKETKKLFKASHIRYIKYPTGITNIVMPNNAYLLSCIYRLMDEALGYELLSFINTCLRYN
ncbi:hypothetical protein CR513_04136, partial [Mucuna pruriens]